MAALSNNCAKFPQEDDTTFVLKLVPKFALEEFFPFSVDLILMTLKVFSLEDCTRGGGDIDTVFFDDILSDLS